MRRYGFVSAGGGERYSGPLRRLAAGDRIAAYLPKRGYVGYGIVAAPAVLAKDFETKTGPLLEQQLSKPNFDPNKDDPRLAEHAVAVDWIKTVPTSEAKTFAGVFANQNIVCKLRDPRTLEFLKEQFGADPN